MPTAIDELDFTRQPISLDALTAGGRPKVLRGMCRHWPIVQKARESETAFAQALVAYDNGSPVDVLHMPPEARGVVGYNATIDGFNYRHFKVSVTDVLQRLAAYSRHDNVPGLAMQSALIEGCLPGFAEAHPMPLLDPSVQPRLWIGNTVTTPAHFDSSHNIAVVVCGRRRFTLFPPEQVANLYVGPIDFAPTVAAMSLPRLDEAGDPRYPRLEEALRHALVAELEPGDAIYMPPVWWHHVQSLERLNALVNYWWRPGAYAGHVPEPGLEALMHAILAYKALPKSERDAWKAMLEHYVFNDADPAEHIPTERRGVLGPLDASRVARLRQLAGKDKKGP